MQSDLISRSKLHKSIQREEPIISITWVEPLHGYTVVWKVREWEENNDAI